MVQEVVGSAVEAKHGPARPGDVQDSLADLTKIRAAVGYEVKVGLREGLENTADAILAEFQKGREVGLLRPRSRQAKLR